MKERPIIFSTPMVQAILEGLKTQTRRVVKPQFKYIYDDNDYEDKHSIFVGMAGGEKQWIKCPHGKPGDLLWVRETHARIPHIMSVFAGVHYFSDGPMPTISECHDAGLLKKYPSIHMPKWAARIWLEITGVRVERVQEITVGDALSEGVGCDFGKHFDPQEPGPEPDYLFSKLWDSINGKKEGCSWAENPWVWIVEFKRVEVK